MSRPEFILQKGSLQEQFLNSRAKVRIYGGGFGNGKTTSLVIDALTVAKEYPGANMLLARSTYPKLNDTLRKEFVKWCPKEWIKSFPMGQNATNVCTLTNGTTINFRYIAQQGRNEEGGTSNLLSATYDYVGIDQVEDPEIVEKDFLDLFGRMRGQARYIGDDPTRPITGPRQMVLTCNPTRNWVYKKIVRPLHIYKATGQITPELLCVRDIHRNPVLKDGKPQILVELFEGSTYELAHIHTRDGGDFIQTLEAAYSGQMRDRFLLGKWAAYEGLVYGEFDTSVHGIPLKIVIEYLNMLIANGYTPNWIEGYDFGIASPSCYALGFVDPHGNVFIIDGFYKREYPVEEQCREIWTIRNRYAPHHEWGHVLADPDVFRRKAGSKKTAGKTISSMFAEEGIDLRKGNNDILNGIVKVGGYVRIRSGHKHPILLTSPAPRLYVVNELTWAHDEFGGYYWQQDNSGQRTDKPVDENDHFMDVLKYMFTDMPDIGGYKLGALPVVPAWMRWQEHDAEEQMTRTKRARYG